MLIAHRFKNLKFKHIELLFDIYIWQHGNEKK